MGASKRVPPDRGKSGVKRSVLTEGHGIPISIVIDGANRHDMKLVRPTIEGLVVKRPKPTAEKPQGMCLDKEYDYEEVRDILCEFGFTTHIRARWEEAKRSRLKPGSRCAGGWWNGHIPG